MPKNLLIPGKNATGASYLRDMQTLEQWARQPIQQLIAGSGVTLDPASGLATDNNGNGPNPITISAAGGGGGVGEFLLEAGPDFNDFASFPFGLAMGPMNQVIDVYTSRWLVTSNSSGSEHVYSFVSSWVWFVAAGDTACFLPFITAPNFTGAATLNYNVVIAALALDQSDNAMYAAELLTIAPNAGLQLTAADFSTVMNGGSGSIVLTGGTGTSGNGLVSTPGNTYFGSVNVNMRIPTGVSF